MSMTDPIADLLTRIRNAHLAKHDRVDIPSSKAKVEICKILKQEGYIHNFSLIEGHPTSTLRVMLRYTEEGLPAIRHLARVSKAGRRVYSRAEEIQPLRSGLGTRIISTSRGLLTDAQAREQRVGGEVLAELW